MTTERQLRVPVRIWCYCAPAPKLRTAFSSQVKSGPCFQIKKRRVALNCLFLTQTPSFSLFFLRSLTSSKTRVEVVYGTCYSLSLQYEVLPTLPSSMCRSSKRRGSPMELCPRSLPSPLYFLVPAQHHVSASSVLDWGILLSCFYPEAESARGVDEGTSPWHLLCTVPIKADTQQTITGSHAWDGMRRRGRVDHSLFIYLFLSRRDGLGLLTCIWTSSPSVTCSGTLKQSMKLKQLVLFM